MKKNTETESVQPEQIEDQAHQSAYDSAYAVGARILKVQPRMSDYTLFCHHVAYGLWRTNSVDYGALKLLDQYDPYAAAKAAGVEAAIEHLWIQHRGGSNDLQ